MTYYTITTDTHTKDSHTQAIMIINADDVEFAKQEYVKTFKLYDFNVVEGIGIPDGFGGLVTEPVKKYLYKQAMGRGTYPLVSYSNRIELKHDEDQ